MVPLLSDFNGLREANKPAEIHTNSVYIAYPSHSEWNRTRGGIQGLGVSTQGDEIPFVSTSAEYGGAQTPNGMSENHTCERESTDVITKEGAVSQRHPILFFCWDFV